MTRPHIPCSDHGTYDTADALHLDHDQAVYYVHMQTYICSNLYDIYIYMRTMLDTLCDCTGTATVFVFSDAHLACYEYTAFQLLGDHLPGPNAESCAGLNTGI